MTWNLVQFNYTTFLFGASPPNPVPIIFTSAQTAGHLVTCQIVFFNQNGSAGTSTTSFTGVTDTNSNGPGGNYKLAINFLSSTPGVNAGQTATWYAWNVVNAAANTNTVNATWNNSGGSGSAIGYCIVIAEWSNTNGIFISDPLDQTAQNIQDDGGADTNASVSVTANAINELVLVFSGGDVGQTTVGTIGGTTATIVTNLGSFGIISEYGVSATTGSITCTTGPPDDGWQIIGVTFKQPLNNIIYPTDVMFHGMI